MELSKFSQKVEPTCDELSQAWTRAIELEGLAGIFSNALLELRDMRRLKYTWYGTKENDLRYAVDSYLRHHHTPI